MYIQELIWDNYRIDHIALHNVEPDEVQEACDDPFGIAYRQGQNRYRLYGQTAAGRYLFIVIERIERSLFKPITARDMEPSERRSFRKTRQ